MIPTAKAIGRAISPAASPMARTRSIPLCSAPRRLIASTITTAPSSTPITTQFASVENCIFVITSRTVSYPYGPNGPIFYVYTSTMTSTYSMNASVKMTTGAVTTSTTSLPYTTTAVTYTPTVANGTTTVSAVDNPYIGEPYNVSCTYVK